MVVQLNRLRGNADGERVEFSSVEPRRATSDDEIRPCSQHADWLQTRHVDSTSLNSPPAAAAAASIRIRQPTTSRHTPPRHLVHAICTNNYAARAGGSVARV